MGTDYKRLWAYTIRIRQKLYARRAGKWSRNTLLDNTGKISCPEESGRTDVVVGRDGGNERRWVGTTTRHKKKYREVVNGLYYNKHANKNERQRKSSYIQSTPVPEINKASRNIEDTDLVTDRVPYTSDC